MSNDEPTVPAIDDERDPTHRVVNKVYRRAYGSGTQAGPHVVEFHPGEKIAPTPHELEFHGDRFEPLPETQAQAEADAEADAQAADEPEPEPEEPPDTDAENGQPPAGQLPDDITTEWVENADYDDLRTAAKRYDEINGNWGEDRLRLELAEVVGENE
jgi:hypothetical protein